MKWLIGLVVIASSLMVNCPGARADSGISWMSSFTDAQSLAKAQNKLVMVDVYTDWCGWCKKLDSDVYPDPAVVQAVSQFVPVKVNAEKEGQDVATQYNVTGYPTILFLNSSGSVVKKIVGYLPADQFADELNTIEKEYAPQSSVSAVRVLIDTDDPSERAVEYAQDGDTADANSEVTALRHHGKVSKLGPLYNRLGDAAVNGGHNDSAVQWYKKALATSSDPHTALFAHLGMATAYLTAQDLSDARTQLRAALRSPAATETIKETVRMDLRQIAGK